MGSQKANEELLLKLEARFRDNMRRHSDLKWDDVKSMLSDKILKSVAKMEETGGEPDVVVFDKNQIAFVDCSAESPSGRRSLCYDRTALDARKQNKPSNSAAGIAEEIGIELLTEDEYMKLQSVGDFDLKTSSWLKTPNDVRSKGGAIFGDKRYGRTFIYHNGADSYYAARGFRGRLTLKG